MTTWNNELITKKESAQISRDISSDDLGADEHFNFEWDSKQ